MKEQMLSAKQTLTNMQFVAWLLSFVTHPKKWRQFNGWLVILWLGVMVLAIALGWIHSLTFIALVSLTANLGVHFGLWGRAKVATTVTTSEANKQSAAV